MSRKKKEPTELDEALKAMKEEAVAQMPELLRKAKEKEPIGSEAALTICLAAGVEMRIVFGIGPKGCGIGLAPKEDIAIDYLDGKFRVRKGRPLRLPDGIRFPEYGEEV